MADTAARLLRLLALLQSRADWTGPALAERLGVTARTVRNDVARLRALGYPVDAAPGAAGGYRLGAGASLPPLLLDDDEAVAVAVGLRLAAGAGIAGTEEASVRALATLDQVLPSRLRRRVAALHAATVALPGDAGADAVDAAVLTALAAAVRERERLRYHDAADGPRARIRTVEPQRLVHARGRWYLVAWDAGEGGWRLLPAARIRPSAHGGPRFRPRPDPEGGLAAFVDGVLGRRFWDYRARVKVLAPAARVIARVPPAVVVEAHDDASCFAHVGADTPRVLAFWLAMIDEEFEAGEHPELATELEALAARYVRAAAAPSGR